MSNGRILGSSKTECIRPELSLVSMTENPVGSLFSLWYGSRHKDTIDATSAQLISSDLRSYINYIDPIQYKRLIEICNTIVEAYPEYALDDECIEASAANVVNEVANLVVKCDVPASECVYFTFCIDNASVAWREQLVRSKHASYWTQTSRTADLATMDCTMLESIELFGGEKAVEVYKHAIDEIRGAYTILRELGVPIEDIRLQPQVHTHRVYWMISLRALIPVISKRADWMAQSSLWLPIMSDLCSILKENVGEFVERYIGNPPVEISRDENGKLYVSKHKYVNENEDRIYGRDPIPADPLYMAYLSHKTGEQVRVPYNSKNYNHYLYMKSLFSQIWSNDILEILGWDNNDEIGTYDPIESEYSTSSGGN